MKNKTKIKFLIFFFILPLFSVLLVNAQNEIAIEWNKAEFFASNIRVNIPEKNGIKIDVGGYEVGDILPLSTYDDGEYKIFNAKAYAYFDVQWYSDQSISSALVGFKAQTQSVKWLSLFYGPSVHRGIGDVKHYYAKYNQYTHSSISSSGKGTNTNYEMNVEVVDLTPSNLDFGNNQFSIITKQFIGSVDRITVIESSVEEIGRYSNYYRSDSQVSMSASTITKEKAEQSKIPHQEAYEEFVTFIDSADLGITNIGGAYDSTIQQGQVSKLAVGKDVTNSVPIKVIPDIKKTVQDRKVRYQYVAVDTKTGFLQSPAGISTVYTKYLDISTVRSNIGYKIKNYVSKATFKVEIGLYAQAKIDIFEDSNTPDLEIPETQMDDIYWDNAQEGVTGVEISIDPTNPITDFFSGIFSSIGNFFKWVAIIGAVLVIGYLLIQASSFARLIPRSSKKGNVRRK